MTGRPGYEISLQSGGFIRVSVTDENVLVVIEPSPGPVVITNGAELTHDEAKAVALLLQGQEP